MNAYDEVKALPSVFAPRKNAVPVDRTRVADRQGVWLGRLLGGVVAGIGVVLAAGGIKLVLLGGSLYYLLSGLSYGVAGVLLARRRPSGAMLVIAMLAATLVWAIREAGLDYWALFPRVLLPAGLALLALLAAVRFPANAWRRATAIVAAAIGISMAIEFAFAFVPHGGVHDTALRAFIRL